MCWIANDTRLFRSNCFPTDRVIANWNRSVIYTDQLSCYNKKRPSKGWSGVHLLHDNASCHKCEVVKSILASEKVKVLNHPPYSPDLSHCDFFVIFPRLKKMLSGNKYTARSSLGSTIHQCLQQIPKKDYLSAFRDWVKRLQKCVSVKREYFEVCNKNVLDKTLHWSNPNPVTKLFAGPLVSEFNYVLLFIFYLFIFYIFLLNFKVNKWILNVQNCQNNLKKAEFF